MRHPESLAQGGLGQAINVPAAIERTSKIELSVSDRVERLTAAQD